MKKPLGILLITGLIFTSMISCSKNEVNTEKEEKLKAYMLGGMYFVYNYGGTSIVKSYAESVGISGRSQMINTYSKIFVRPISQEDEDQAKEALQEWWGISNKQDLLECLDKLKTQDNAKNPHKAWDIARAVNNACLGHSCRYLTAEECDNYVAELLTLVKSRYNTWEDYMNDFLEGRRLAEQNNKSDIQEFTEIVEEMFGRNHKTNIYEVLKLN